MFGHVTSGDSRTKKYLLAQCDVSASDVVRSC